MPRPRPGALRVLAVGFAAFILALLHTAAPGAISSGIVISQVYGGGGNSGATYRNDFIELFNRGSAPIDVTGWSVQYASAAGSSWQVTTLSGTIQPGAYYLVQEAAGAGGTVSLPAPDASGGIPMAASAGKVALVSSTASLSGTCPAGGAIVDFVGFGSTATCSEGSPTATLSNTTAALRGDGGCLETDTNSTDFERLAPAPRNSASPLNVCDGPPPVPALSIADVTVTEGDSGTATATFTVSLNVPAPAGGVTFDISTSDGTATSGIDYVATSRTGQSIAEGELTYAFDVPVNGDTEIEPSETFLVTLSNAAGAIVADGEATGTIQTDDVAPPAYDVVISQVYGGGGNSGATYRNDFIELFNRGTTPVDLSGWTVQYGSASGTGSWQTTALGGTIEPGRYYLVRQAAGSGGTTDVPTPDAVGSISMAGASGKVALRASAAALSGACAADSTIIDLVGYGSANCAEGTAAAQISNSTAALRKRGGCHDTNDNFGDFSVRAPTPRNSSSAARSCSYLTAPIHAIQGAGVETPYFGQDVTTTGIVTGVKVNGFFLQSADAGADADPATSEALFVFTGFTPTLAPGDAALVRGTATEYFTLTQIESSLPGDVSVVSTGHALPAPLPLGADLLDPAAAATALERFEGMRMQAGALVSVGPTNDFGEIDTVLNGVARPMREPGIDLSLTVPPDPVTGVVDCCIPRWDENRERLALDTDGLLGSAPAFVTSNVTIAGATGPLDFSFGRYKLLPEGPLMTSANIGATAVPVPAPNEFTVAGYNIENFTGSETQRRKAALAIREVMRYPDVIGVIEIASLNALAELATQVNSDAVAAGDPNPAYEARLIPAPGGGTQHVGFLVKTSRVLIHGVTQERAADVLPTGAPLHDRPPLVLDATVDPAGVNPGRILVVVNHPRSFIDIEGLDAEGARVRDKRKAQAESIAGLLQELQAANPGVPVIAVGDYNAYEFSDGFTDPMSVMRGAPTPGDRIVVSGSPDLVEPDFVNLTETLPAPQRYSFVFEGTPQALDHVLVNQVAHSYFQRYAVARANADFPQHPLAGLSTDATRPEANSDHDAPVAYFAFPGTPVVTLNGGATMTVEAFTSFVDPGATARDDRGSLPVVVSGSVNVDVPGTYTLDYTATNTYATTTVTRTVIVADTLAPVIDSFSVTPDMLGAPDHKMVDVRALHSSTDASGVVTCSLGVASNEPVDGRGDGDTEIDWEVLDATHLRLRAERAGQGDGRIYTVTLTCADPSGNAASRSAIVRVAK